MFSPKYMESFRHVDFLELQEVLSVSRFPQHIYHSPRQTILTFQAWAQRDFDRRVDDYQQLYHATVKHTELEPEGVYRYYSTQRPVDIGTYPKPPDNQPLSIVNYDDDRRRPVADGMGRTDLRKAADRKADGGL